MTILLPAEREYGLVHDVRSHHLGSRLVGDYSASATVLTVEDASDFNESGGQVMITSTVSGDLTVNQYGYSSVDFDADTITLTSGIETDVAFDGDPIEVYPLESVYYAEVVAAELGESITALVPHSLLRLLPVGIRDPGDEESVQLVLHQGGEWEVTNVLGKGATLQSMNYDETLETGWMLDDTSAYFTDLSVGSELGVGILTAESILLDGQDLSVQAGTGPVGCIARAYLGEDGGVNSANVTSETVIWIFNAGSLYADRVYLITCRGTYTATGGQAGQVLTSRLRYTTDGSNPTTSSGLMMGSALRAGIDSDNTGPYFQFAGYYSPVSDYSTVKIALTIVNETDAPSGAQLKLDETDNRSEIAVYDMGAEVNVGGTISQKSVASGNPDPDPGGTYTKTYNATWSQSYDNDGGQRQGGDNGYCYQGYYDGTHGNQKSLVGFDYNQIQADLSGGSTTINWVKLTFHVIHSYYNDGATIIIKEHDQTSAPSNYPAPTIVDTVYNKKSGVTYTVGGSGAAWIALGNHLRDNSSKGIGFGRGDTTARRYYAYMRGNNQSGQPYLTINYTK